MIPGLWMFRLIVFSVGAYLHMQGGTKATRLFRQRVENIDCQVNFILPCVCSTEYSPIVADAL